VRRAKPAYVSSALPLLLDHIRLESFPQIFISAPGAREIYVRQPQVSNPPTSPTMSEKFLRNILSGVAGPHN